MHASAGVQTCGVENDRAKTSKLGLEVTVDDTGRELFVSKIHDGGPAESDGRLKIGDKIVSIQPLSPEAWISSHSPSVTTQSPQLVLASLESQHPGPWVVVVLRHGCDDVIEVEITPNASSGGRGGGPGVRQAAHNSSFGAAAIQKNLWEQLVQATAPKKANWQTKAARVGMPGFGGEFKEHVWEEVWEGPDDEPEEDKQRDPETGLLLQYGTDVHAAHYKDGKLGRLPLILAGLGAVGALCLFFHFMPHFFPSLHL